MTRNHCPIKQVSHHLISIRKKWQTKTTYHIIQWIEEIGEALGKVTFLDFDSFWSNVWHTNLMFVISSNWFSVSTNNSLIESIFSFRLCNTIYLHQILLNENFTLVPFVWSTVKQVWNLVINQFVYIHNLKMKCRNN